MILVVEPTYDRFSIIKKVRQVINSLATLGEAKKQTLSSFWRGFLLLLVLPVANISIVFVATIVE